MKNIFSLVNRLKSYLPDLVPSSGDEIISNPPFDGCSCPGVIEDSVYFYVPRTHKMMQQNMKKEIKNYSNSNGLEFVVSKTKFCSTVECTGDYVDPFKEKEGEHVFMNDFPDSLNGSYLYFLKPENMEFLRIIQSGL